MKKLIILSIFALSFSTISPTFAAEMPDSTDVTTIQVTVPNVLPASENVLHVLPISPDVRPAVEAVVVSTENVIVPVISVDPLPSGTLPNHIPSPVKNIDPVNEINIVTPPCVTACPNPLPIITPVTEIIITPCLSVNMATSRVDVSVTPVDRIVLPANPCPSITPVVEQTFSGSGGGSIILPTNVLPGNEPATDESSIEVPGQKVLGEQKVVLEKSTSPSFPRTGAAPVALPTSSTSTTPSTTSNAIMSFSYSNDRKRQYSIA